MPALRKLYKSVQQKQSDKLFNLKKSLEQIDVKLARKSETAKANRNNEIVSKIEEKENPQ